MHRGIKTFMIAGSVIMALTATTATAFAMTGRIQSKNHTGVRQNAAAVSTCWTGSDGSGISQTVANNTDSAEVVTTDTEYVNDAADTSTAVYADTTDASTAAYVDTTAGVCTNSADGNCWVDNDGDGICDYYNGGNCANNGSNWVDNDGDGVCDNYGGGHYGNNSGEGNNYGGGHGHNYGGRRGNGHCGR